ncbi:hypothetical protein HAT93_00001 [Dickeya solani]|nr:hypothetical protein [Dickeya solani]
MHIADPLHAVFRDRPTTDPFSRRNTHAGRAPLKRPQKQRIVVQQVKAGPIHTIQSFKQ